MNRICTYDPEAKAMYIKLKEGTVLESEVSSLFIANKFKNVKHDRYKQI